MEGENFPDAEDEMAATHPMEKRSASARPVRRPEPAPPKRRKEKHDPGNYALVSCFDERDNFVEVDLRVLEPFNCRLYTIIKHQEPDICPHTNRPTGGAA